ncbi:hypothetical protein BOTBODRAFT_479753 [Botryobasidium botryosum FD-172 SS1]|uniref:Fungal-type protein kinase domain-containing protein n=1 Tax=Botryobasidium botryosum (strain FD-172 SS1) TaxID=930990 RepID=A0A067N492_BOTB1|nr:hypothetical protein BOTBODRAFT_479753 [Botryobasidium botryosum FD-172 SS1]
MTSDPTRRFVFGVTIEDVDMQLWYCDRSGCVASERFNYTVGSGVLSFVHTFVSLACAKDHQLGFDVGMRQTPVTDGYSQGDLEMTVGKRIFYTTRPISNTGPDRVRSRGTRVWATCDKDNLDCMPRALKDCWANNSRHGEGDTYATILDHADRLPAEAQKAKEGLLTGLCHRNVLASASYPNDTTFIRKECTIGIPPDRPAIALVRPANDGPSASVHLSNIVGEIPQLPRVSAKQSASPRTHYRIFNEKGVPASSLTNMTSVLTTLVGVAKGLNLLDKCGFIHGDVSIHNMLLVGSTGKLCDLEYVRESGGFNIAGHTYTDHTGTSAFLSHELTSGDWIYTTPDYMRATDDTPNFTQHILHDAESLWWVFVHGRKSCSGLLRPSSCRAGACLSQIFEPESCQ